MGWVKAENCQIVHPYGEEGWRPLLNDEHEHWEPDDFPVQEHVPVDGEGLWMSLSRDAIASLGIWLAQQGQTLANFADDEAVVDGELIYLALTLMSNLSTVADKNGPMLTAALVKVLASDNPSGEFL